MRCISRSESRPISFSESHGISSRASTRSETVNPSPNHQCKCLCHSQASFNVPPLCMMTSVTVKSSGLAISRPKSGRDSLSRLATFVPLLTGTSLGDSETWSFPACTRTHPESVVSLHVDNTSLNHRTIELEHAFPVIASTNIV